MPRRHGAINLPGHRANEQQGGGVMAKASKKKKALPTKKQMVDINLKRANVYREMENSVCDLARAAELAMTVFDNDRLFLFAVEQLDFMAQRFRDRYYAEEFPGDN
jgi:hypothetical protein